MRYFGLVILCALVLTASAATVSTDVRDYEYNGGKAGTYIKITGNTTVKITPIADDNRSIHLYVRFSGDLNGKRDFDSDLSPYPFEIFLDKIETVDVWFESRTHRELVVRFEITVIELEFTDSVMQILENTPGLSTVLSGLVILFVLGLLAWYIDKRRNHNSEL